MFRLCFSALALGAVFLSLNSAQASPYSDCLATTGLQNPQLCAGLEKSQEEVQAELQGANPLPRGNRPTAGREERLNDKAAQVAALEKECAAVGSGEEA